ncbi:large-conductance mechanosensitive channel protein MscL [Wenzhouxiangella marina]|uniref:Large-conductance mechanosensitive channel n=1 Tax=Wenzhouxiangella marina TaxID=1579979 RepID=A0A0K0XSF1_9GAMM|nr:large-conductance mechanosensitive channel protein MscL [Wenzhouxiangella marina]AKS40585.1 Large-conductance mechanosensitive channel [Wenzhouxiangella marina]MBB6088353.1 large conductance mechanosensitive channel [Wenzhouxiangella marina]
MSLMKEFREFAVKGNMVDMAVGIIIGAAFGRIISSLVNDVIMPPLGLLIGGVDFSDLAVVLQQAEGEGEAVLLRYGLFINNLIDFVIIAFAIFMAIKVMNRLKRKEEAKPAEPAKPPRQEVLLEEIRDLLKKQAS